jgi:hypothetical protein
MLVPVCVLDQITVPAQPVAVKVTLPLVQRLVFDAEITGAVFVWVFTVIVFEAVAWQDPAVQVTV